jgi:hypothetical protein
MIIFEVERSSRILLAQGPGSYTYGYDVQDPTTGNTQFREETRKPDGTVRGSYGLVEPDGNVKIVHYIADSNGFRYEKYINNNITIFKEIFDY